MPKRVGNVELYMGPKEVGGPDDRQLGTRLNCWTIGERRHSGRSMNGAHIALVELLVVRVGRGVRLLRLARKAAPVALATIAATVGLMIGR